MNRKFQRSRRRFSMSRLGAVSADLAVVFAGRAEGLVELLQQIGELEVLRRLEGIVVLQQRERHAGDRHPLAAGSVVHLRDVFRDGVAVEERGDGNGFLGFLVDHHGHADAAIRVAAAAQCAPVLVRPVNQVGPIGEGAHERDGEPVAGGLAQCRSGSSRRAPDATACSAARDGARR